MRDLGLNYEDVVLQKMYTFIKFYILLLLLMLKNNSDPKLLEFKSKVKSRINLRHGPHNVLFLFNNNNMYINYILIFMFYQYFS